MMVNVAIAKPPPPPPTLFFFFIAPAHSHSNWETGIAEYTGKKREKKVVWVWRCPQLSGQMQPTLTANCESTYQ